MLVSRPGFFNTILTPFSRDLTRNSREFFFLFKTSFKTLYGTSVNTFNPLCSMIYNTFINHSLKDKGNRQNIFPFDFENRLKDFVNLKHHLEHTE